MLAKPPMWWPGIDRQHRLAQGLVGAWPLLEGGGRYIHDYSDSRLHCSAFIAGGPPWVGGPRGLSPDFQNAYYFQSARAGHPSLQFGTTQDFSLAFGFKYSTQNEGLFGQGWQPGWTLKQTTEDITVYLGEGIYTTVGNKFPANVWHDVVITVDRDVNLYAWLNGVFIESFGGVTTGDNASGTTEFLLGTRTIGGAGWANPGPMSYVYVWDHVITRSTISQVAADPWAMCRMLPISRRCVSAAPPAQPMPIVAARGIHSVIHGGLVLQG